MLDYFECKKNIKNIFYFYNENTCGQQCFKRLVWRKEKQMYWYTILKNVFLLIGKSGNEWAGKKL